MSWLVGPVDGLMAWFGWSFHLVNSLVRWLMRVLVGWLINGVWSVGWPVGQSSGGLVVHLVG